MKKIKAVLFDFDGVIVNTEPQYDVYFNDLAQRYKLGIDDFASKIKGVTLPDMFKLYFADFSKEEQEKITKETEDFEVQMNFDFIPGADKFIEYLKEKSYKLALVTSSPQVKIDVALKKMQMEKTFDTIVTANQITKGKPDPMCYLLAAKNLGMSPDECVVFEDSKAGISAGINAGMKVVGLSTTLPTDEVKKYTNNIIPDFSDLSLVISLLEP